MDRPTRRQAALILGLCVAASAVITAMLAPAALTRDAALDVALRRAPPAWALAWTTDPGTPANGFWIDLVEQRVPPAAGEPGAFTSVEPLHIRRPLPTYPLRDLTLRWEGAGLDAGMTFVHAEAITRFLGMRVQSQTLIAPEELLRERPLEAASGGVALIPPGPLPYKGFFAAVVFVMSLVGCVVAAAAVMGLISLEPRWERVRPRLAIRSPKGVRCVRMAAFALATAAPLYLCWWAPVTLFADSTAFIWLSKSLWATHDAAHFDGWRLPGYAVFIAPFVALTKDYPRWVGLMQSLLALPTALATWDIARRRGLACPWPEVAMLAGALNPMVIVWQRVLLSESVGVFLTIAAAWVFVRFEPRLRDARPGRRVIAPFAGLGMLSGVAAVTRGNLQLLPVALGGAALLTGLMHRRLPRAMVACGAMGICFALMLAPWVASNVKKYDRASLMVGASAGRTVFAWQNTDIDFNQTAAFSFEEYRALRDRVAKGEVSDWDFCAVMQRDERIPVPDGTRSWLARDLRSGVVLRESIARMPDRYARRLGDAALAHLGFWIDHPWYFSNLAADMLRVYLGVHSPNATNFYDRLERFPEDIRPTLARGVRDISAVPDSPNAFAFRQAWRVARRLRPVLSVLLGLAALRALARRDVVGLTLAGVVAANIAGVVLIQFSAEARYSMVLQGLADLALVLCLFTPPRSLPDRGGEGLFAQPS